MLNECDLGLTCHKCCCAALVNVYVCLCVHIRFEKMISGMYMGELVRLILVECINKKLLFSGTLSEELSTPHRFYTKYVSEIEK